MTPNIYLFDHAGESKLLTIDHRYLQSTPVSDGSFRICFSKLTEIPCREFLSERHVAELFERLETVERCGVLFGDLSSRWCSKMIEC
jgi:hypothetical protein